GEKCESSGHHSLLDPQLRLSGAGGTRAFGGAGLCVDRAMGAARVAHAVAHFYPARDVAGIGRGEPRLGGRAPGLCGGSGVRQREATESEELHALDYAAYSYLQEGEDDKAKEIVDFAATVRRTNPEMEFTAAYALAAIPARYALERNDWPGAAALAIPNVPHWSSFPFMEALIEYAHALGRAHTGDLDGAQKAIERMRQLREATTDS